MRGSLSPAAAQETHRWYPPSVLGLRAFLLRLVAAAFVMAAASNGASRAPHALRAWTDTASEIARTSSAPTAARRPTAPPRLAQPARFPLRPRRAPTLAPGLADRLLGTRAWPSASTGRDVLTLKRARLI
jgi:hypothetical protein